MKARFLLIAKEITLGLLSICLCLPVVKVDFGLHIRPELFGLIRDVPWYTHIGVYLAVVFGVWSPIKRLVLLLARSRHERRPTKLDPPVAAEFLFYLFMTPHNCDALVGDLEERWKLIHKKFGHRRANFWYWTQTVRSLGPILWAWGKRCALKPAMALVGWAVAKGLVGHDSWLAALVELLKRVRS